MAAEPAESVGVAAAQFLADCAELPGPEVRRRLNVKHYGRLPPRAWILFHLDAFGR